MLGCIQPMSSPMMNRMFGCCACCALAGLAVMAAVRTVAPNSAARDADRMCARLSLSQDLSIGSFKSSVDSSLLIAPLIASSLVADVVSHKYAHGDRLRLRVPI